MEYLQAIENGELKNHENLRLLIWSKRGEENTSEFFENVDDAWKRCETLKNDYDVYTSLGLRHRHQKPLAKGRHKNLRGGELDVWGLLGLAMEFDIANEARVKAASSKRDDSKLFGSVEEITEFLHSLPLRTTMLVNSGGGVHAYWLFKELWTLDENSRTDAKAISLGWHKYVSDYSKRKVDSTYSLDRVYRVAGTINHKYEGGVEVVVLDMDDNRRYNPSEFEGWKVNLRDLMKGRLRVDPKIELPKSVVNLVALAPEFAEVWHHTSRRLEGKSQSEFDLSLANLMKDAGLPKEEIANAIAFNRSIHGAKEKPAGYYALTLGKAGVEDADPDGGHHSNAVDTKHKTALPVAESGTEAPSEGGKDERETYFEALSQAVGIRILGIDYIDRGEGHESFTFFIYLHSGQKIPVGTIGKIRSQPNWQNIRTTAPRDQIHARTPGKNAWDELISRVLLYAVNNTGTFDTVGAAILLEIYHYLMAVRLPVMDFEVTARLNSYAVSGSPFLYGKLIHFTTNGFRRWYQMNIGKLDDHIMSRYLKEVGFEQKRVSGRRWWVYDHDKFLQLIGEDSDRQESTTEEDERGVLAEYGAPRPAGAARTSPFTAHRDGVPDGETEENPRRGGVH